jgi:hypothetical protein
MILCRRERSSESPQTVPEFENDWANTLAAADAAYEYVYSRREIKPAPSKSWLASSDPAEPPSSDPQPDPETRSSPSRA